MRAVAARDIEVKGTLRVKTVSQATFYMISSVQAHRDMGCEWHRKHPAYWRPLNRWYRQFPDLKLHDFVMHGPASFAELYLAPEEYALVTQPVRLGEDAGVVETRIGKSYRARLPSVFNSLIPWLVANWGVTEDSVAEALLPAKAIAQRDPRTEIFTVKFRPKGAR